MISIEKKYILVIIGILGTIFITFASIFVGQKSDLKQAIIEENNLEIEFRKLNVLPGAREATHNAFHKEGLASIYTSYVTNKSYDEIRSYYLEEVPKNGWVFMEEKSLTEWGKDFGAKQLSFKKNQYQLIITYRGEKADDNGTFGISTRWSIW